MIPNFSTSEAQVYYMPNIHKPLLGVRSFLSNFQLLIDYPQQSFSLRKPTPWTRLWCNMLKSF